MLAEIHFVSQRSMLGEDKIQHFTSLGYSELVRQICLANRPNDISLHFVFNRQHPRFEVNDRIIDFSKHKLEFAFYAMLARSNQNEDAAIERPTDVTNVVLVTKALCQELTLLAKPQHSWRENQHAFGDELEYLDVLHSRTKEAILSKPEIQCLTQNQFDARKNALSKLLKQHFPQAMADILMPSSAGKGKPYWMNLPEAQIRFSHS